MTADIPQEAVERAIALVREMAVGDPRIAACPHCTEARAIVALLPEPADPLLVEARALCADDTADRALRARYMNGSLDGTPLVTMAYSGIRRGRELALKARAVGEGS